MSHPVRIVEIEELAPALIDTLVAGVGASHRQRSIHVHVMGGEVEGDEELEDDYPARESGGQEYEQTGRAATIGDHI